MVEALSFFLSSRRRHTSYIGDWSSDVCSSDLAGGLRDIARFGGGLERGQGAAFAFEAGVGRLGRFESRVERLRLGEQRRIVDFADALRELVDRKSVV